MISPTNEDSVAAVYKLARILRSLTPQPPLPLDAGEGEHPFFPRIFARTTALKPLARWTGEGLG
ncbi:hypothetical protein JOD20_002609 [Herpetosiphon giganteus]|nr:hypothetical protein [Herpetosiphon giganteus]